jgi:hypothetical protein
MATVTTARSEPRALPEERSAAGPHEATNEPGADPAEALTRVLIQALRALGELGAPERANRLAGRAWSALRRPRPELAKRINALMHGLAKMPSDPVHDDPSPPR